MADSLEYDAVAAVLRENPLVSELHVYGTISSTNAVARRLAESGAPHGTLILAEAQSAGRGRQGKSWASPPGCGLWMSLLLRAPDFAFREQLLPLLLCESIAAALRTLTKLDVSVKWPNDVLIHDRKICGILCEASYRNDVMMYIIAGIGINVNQVPQDFPPHLQGVATSLRAASCKRWDRLTLLQHILRAVASRLREKGPDLEQRVLSRWRALSQNFGRTIAVRQGRTVFTGLFLDIGPSGELILQDHTGQIRRLISGEATIVKESL